MASMVFKMQRSSVEPKNITVSFNADKFERIAANFGLFREEFLNSLDRAERNIRDGKVKKIKSLASLRK